MARFNALILLASCFALTVASVAARKCKSPPPKPPRNCKRAEALCSLYKDTCCPGYMCIMTPKCTQLAGPAACQPTCQKRVSVVLKRVVLPSGLAVWEAGKKTAPAVVVLQEWWGVNDAIKETAYFIGQQGYRVAIPDLYGGEFELGVNSSHAVLLSMKLNWTQAVADMTNTVQYLKATGSKKVAVTGFCQGGGLALCAAQFSGVVAAAPFYGAPSNGTAPQCKVEQIKVPVQYSWGELDPSSGNFNNTANRMAAAGVDVVKYIYKDAPHAFMNFLTPLARAFAILGGRPTPPEAEIKLAFARLTDFLAKHLLNK